MPRLMKCVNAIDLPRVLLDISATTPEPGHAGPQPNFGPRHPITPERQTVSHFARSDIVIKRVKADPLQEASQMLSDKLPATLMSVKSRPLFVMRPRRAALSDHRRPRRRVSACRRRSRWYLRRRAGCRARSRQAAMTGRPSAGDGSTLLDVRLVLETNDGRADRHELQGHPPRAPSR